MIAGEFDLSVGAVVSVAGLILVKTGETSPLLGIGMAVGAGLAIGFLNAVLAMCLRVSTLVTTLGTMILLSGVAVWIEGGQVAAYDNFDAAEILDQHLLGIFSPRSLCTVVIYFLSAILLFRTRVGRDIYAAGSDRKATTMGGAGVRVALVSEFLCSGMLAGLAGALTSISLATASSRFGADLVLQAATAAIVGGVNRSGFVGDC